MKGMINLYKDLVITGNYDIVNELGRHGPNDSILRYVFNEKSQDFCKTLRDAMSVIRQHFKKQGIHIKVKNRISPNYGLVKEIYFNKKE